MFRFEKLEVWKRSINFADRVYEVTRGFPAEERFGLTSQMRRAAVSVSSNIAEGSGRNTDKNFAHFISIAYGSVLEVLSQTEIAMRQSYIPRKLRDELYEDAEQLTRMLSGLRSSLKRT